VVWSGKESASECYTAVKREGGDGTTITDPGHGEAGGVCHAEIERGIDHLSTQGKGKGTNDTECSKSTKSVSHSERKEIHTP